MDLGAGVVWRPQEMREVARTLPLARYYLPPEWLTVSYVKRPHVCQLGFVVVAVVAPVVHPSPHLLANGIPSFVLCGGCT